MKYLQSLAPSVNISYVNIIIDVGTALNAFRFLWNELEKYQNFVIHLEDFHFMKENFQVTCLRKNRLTFEQKLFTYKNGFFLLHRSPFVKCCVRMVILWEFFLINRKQCVMGRSQDAAAMMPDKTTVTSERILAWNGWLMLS